MAQSYDLAALSEGIWVRHDARSADGDNTLSVNSTAVLGTVTFQLEGLMNPMWVSRDGLYPI